MKQNGLMRKRKAELTVKVPPFPVPHHHAEYTNTDEDGQYDVGHNNSYKSPHVDDITMVTSC